MYSFGDAFSMVTKLSLDSATISVQSFCSCQAATRLPRRFLSDGLSLMCDMVSVNAAFLNCCLRSEHLFLSLGSVLPCPFRWYDHTALPLPQVWKAHSSLAKWLCATFLSLEILGYFLLQLAWGASSAVPKILVRHWVRPSYHPAFHVWHDL